MRQVRGAANYKAGRDAEGLVARRYRDRGARPLAVRWRGRGGEIDLVMQKEGQTIFVEVKRAADFDTAAERIRPAQIARIFSTAQEFLGAEPDGLLTNCRFDVALVDAQGRLKVLENALAA